MLTETQKKSANFIRIVAALKYLRDTKVITEKEYCRAKKYYRRLTGADIIILH